MTILRPYLIPYFLPLYIYGNCVSTSVRTEYEVDTGSSLNILWRDRQIDHAFFTDLHEHNEKCKMTKKRPQKFEVAKKSMVGNTGFEPVTSSV